MREIYLDNAATSKPHPRTLACAQQFIDTFTSEEKAASDITREMRSYLTGAREKAAELIHCDADEIALVQSTTHGLGIAANAIPLKKGDNILICDLEYQASTACWKPRVCKLGAELREVKSHNGAVTAADFEAAMDAHTKAITLASVQEINGYRADLREIADLCHARGCYLLVDGVQECGAMQVNVREMGADFYCGGGKKWLGNPFGMSFLYIKRELVQKLDPMYYGYFSLKFPSKFPDYVSYLEDPARDPFDDDGIINDASKFEIMGFPNYIGALGLSEAIQVQLDYGPEKIEEKIRTLHRHLLERLRALGITMCSPTDEKHMSSIASFNFGFPGGSIEREKALVAFLQERGIKVSLRSSTGTGGIRISMHYYNSLEDIDALADGIRDFLK